MLFHSQGGYISNPSQFPGNLTQHGKKQSLYFQQARNDRHKHTSPTPLPPTPSPHHPCMLTFTCWGCCSLCFWPKPTQLAHSFLFCSCVYFCLCGPFNCISFHKFSPQLSTFSLSSFGLISALLVLSTVYLFKKVSFSPDIILCGWLGLKRQLTN